MKNKFYSLLILIFGLLVFSGESYAIGVPITGTAFGDKIGLIHFDYKTAEKPTTNPNFNETDSEYYVGPTKQFYVDPQNEIFDIDNPFVPGHDNIAVNISVEEDDCTIDGCLLTGFLWSDKIGWIVIDGKQIDTAVSTAVNLDAGEENTASDPYPSYMFPRIKMVPIAPNNRVSLTGYAWNEYTGWIRLSSDDSGTIGVVTDVNSQALGNWGLWMEINEEMKKVLIYEGTDDETELKLGRSLHGYGWSEKLGWIKFTSEPEDTFDFNFGAFTVWVPDKEPPVFLGPEKIWFAPGVNTGDHENKTAIVWDNFAADTESGINHETSEIYIKLAEGAIGKCSDYIPPGDSIRKTTHSFPSDYPVSAETLDKLNGEILSLTLPLIGNVKLIPSGFCKYEVHAKIVDLVKNTIYIGNYFLDTATNPDYDPTDPPGMTADALNVFVRAGNYSAENSEVKLMTPGSAIADGKEAVRYQVDLNDIAGNPIIDINCKDSEDPYYQYDECPERRVKITATLQNDLVYDLIQGNLEPPYLTPVKHSETDVANSGSELLAQVDTTNNPEYLWDGTEADKDNKNKWTIPVHPVIPPYHYPLEIASYAPSTSYLANTKTAPSRTLQIKSFNYSIENDSLPATSKVINSLEPTTTVDDVRTIIDACNEPSPDLVCVNPYNVGDPDNKCALGTLSMKNTQCSPSDTHPHFPGLTFIPPIFTDNANLVAGGISNVLSLSVPANLKFDINNISSKGINQTEGGGLSIDNVFQYYSPAKNPSVALMELHRIDVMPEGDRDGHLAWSDPFESCDYCTRYELYDGSHSDITIGDIDAGNSPFHGVFQEFHPSYKFSYDFGLESLGIQNNGTYAITGRESIPHDFPPNDPEGDLSDPTNYEDGEIDRSDPSTLVIGNGSASSPIKISKEIQFTPEKFIPVTINDIKFQVVQEIAYRFADQNLFTIYADEEPLITNIDVKDIGVEAIGTVAGDQIVTNRQFDVVGTASTKDLQEQIRRNVAELVAGVEGCDVKELNAFETSGNCVTADSVNGTLFAFYEGGSDEELVLGNGTDDLTAPSVPYTIIVKGGANVFIKSNIIYSGPNASLGIIVIAEEIGNGANTYISHVPTNIAATLYTEGSVISRPADSTIASNLSDPALVYYGGGGGDVQDLGSQLYWQGSIASRNTIGGAGQEKVPDGIECLEGDARLNCAQRYDFDYLRRFTTVNKHDDSDHPEEVTASLVANKGNFSGGGSCDNDTGTCTAGLLETLIALDGEGYIDEENSELAPFFVEKDSRVLNNPPPGFTISGGLDSTQEIR